jgi:hypothetical protein
MKQSLLQKFRKKREEKSSLQTKRQTRDMEQDQFLKATGELQTSKRQNGLPLIRSKRALNKLISNQQIMQHHQKKKNSSSEARGLHHFGLLVPVYHPNFELKISLATCLIILAPRSNPS